MSVRERRAGEQLATRPAASRGAPRAHGPREGRLVAPVRPLHRHAGRRQDASHLANERLAPRRVPSRAFQGLRRSVLLRYSLNFKTLLFYRYINRTGYRLYETFIRYCIFDIFGLQTLRTHCVWTGRRTARFWCRRTR